jgi:hypothetical protein
MKRMKRQIRQAEIFVATPSRHSILPRRIAICSAAIRTADYSNVAESQSRSGQRTNQATPHIGLCKKSALNRHISLCFYESPPYKL